MYQTGDTIRQTLEGIESHKFVLPAIQREFVWKPTQITRLFDSMMQGYPFGTFLYWEVEPQNSSRYRFYDFVRDYHQRDQPHCPPLAVQNNKALTAVLDGQQRLTALNIGLRGSMAWKLQYKWWNNPDAFPIRYLYLDLLADADEEETGVRYRFAFLTPERAEKPEPGECWFKVADILAMEPGPPLLAWLNERLEQADLNKAFSALDRLFQIVHNKNLVAYYQEKSQDLEKVLNIFIRMNSGGTILSYSDLLLSVAVAQWTRLDAREEIHSLVDEINQAGDGFRFSKDLVLKAGLMLSDIGNVGFKVANFNRDNMAVLEEKWPEIRRALVLTVELMSSYGFTGQTLRADSAILPIAYYLFRQRPKSSYVTHNRYAEDRDRIRQWVVRSLVKSGIWGSGLDTLLTALREVLREHGRERFPAKELHDAMARRGKSLAFDPEEVEELLDMRYGDGRLFPLLSLLFPFIDLRNHFHVDHVFARSRFSPKKLRTVGVADEKIDVFREKAESLANLQLLQDAINIEKQH
ncbi:MAG: DUF262 domain-containing protein, partial [bacterium]|nr:DUF262 domain-containing protein [bacterium]